MTDSESAIDEENPSERSQRRKSYFRRPTIRGLKKEVTEWTANYTSDIRKKFDQETRLPDHEAVHLGGLVLVESFTPSNVSSLFTALNDFPTNRLDHKVEWTDRLAKSRGGVGFAWVSLGMVRRPGGFILDGFHDSSLPEGIDAASLTLFFLTPSLSMVAATFTISE